MREKLAHERAERQLLEDLRALAELVSAPAPTLPPSSQAPGSAHSPAGEEPDADAGLLAMGALVRGLHQQIQPHAPVLKLLLSQGEESPAQSSAAAAASSAGRRRFFPVDRVADRGLAIARIEVEGQYVASPSIVKLDTERLLVVLERSVTWGDSGETASKLVLASDTGGATWAHVGSVGPMNWPQIFRCASGVYVIGTQRHFSTDNNLVISKMLDAQGSRWSPPVQLTRGWSVVAANTGVDVSNGRVTKTFEVIPSMAETPASTRLREELMVPLANGTRGSETWLHRPLLRAKVESTLGMITYTLVRAPRPEPDARPFFFRVMGVDHESRELLLRLERFNHYFAHESALLAAGQSIQVGSGGNVYGGVDWVACAMNADEHADLTLPGSWALPEAPVGNPAAVHADALRELFGVAFRADGAVRNSIVGFQLKGVGSEAEAWEAGFGSIYWMEGVVTRVRDRHGGNGKLLSIMRVNNDWMCDLAALVEYDDEGVALGGAFTARFLRYATVPGLGVGHPAIVYDEVSDLYWMASNVNRDAARRWRNPPAEERDRHPALHITPFSKCEVDRSTLALFYSPNLFNWQPAGIVDYHRALHRHFTYPHMIVDGDDLLIVSRASFAPWARDDSELNAFYSNHNSNSVSFHRVRNFRRLANAAWALEQGVYSEHPRANGPVIEVSGMPGAAKDSASS